jgi:hypothetical protein
MFKSMVSSIVMEEIDRSYAIQKGKGGWDWPGAGDHGARWVVPGTKKSSQFDRFQLIGQLDLM